MQVAGYACSAHLFPAGQLLKACGRELEHIFHKISRYNIALHVASVDGTFRDLGDWMPVLVLSVWNDMDWKNPWRGPCGKVVVNLHQVLVSYDQKDTRLWEVDTTMN
jgi:hypothetical protein